MKGRMKIALLAGGWSKEREVSIKSGKAVYKALDKEKYNVHLYDPRIDLQLLIDKKEEIRLVFSLLHGKFGEDGCIQGLLEIIGIPYVGSGVLASAMAMNKKIAKWIFISKGIKVAKDMVLMRGKGYSVKECMNVIGSKTIVKPLAEGSSIGMSLCGTEEELRAGIEAAFRYDEEVMVEEYINGREITCCVLGNRELRTLPVIEIKPMGKYRLFDYEAKYKNGATDEICPADITSSVAAKVQSYAKDAHKALKCSVWSRADMIFSGENVFVLEINTIPGMTENSLFPLAARSAGMSLSDLVDELIELSLEEKDLKC